MKQLLRSLKDVTPPEEKSGIYQINCQIGCPARYIGQTKRKIKDRLQEHLNHFRNGEEQRSAVALHLLQGRHGLHPTVPLKLLLAENDERHLVF